MLNILLAILVDSYSDVKSDTGAADTMPTEIAKLVSAVLDAPPFKRKDATTGANAKKDAQLLKELQDSLHELQGGDEAAERKALIKAAAEVDGTYAPCGYHTPPS